MKFHSGGILENLSRYSTSAKIWQERALCMKTDTGCCHTSLSSTENEKCYWWNTEEEIETHILCCSVSPPPPPENRAVCEIRWNTHSQYVIFIAFPPHQWLHQRTSLLRYMCIAAPVAYILCCSLCCLHADQILPSCRHWAWSGEICLWKKERTRT